MNNAERGFIKRAAARACFVAMLLAIGLTGCGVELLTTTAIQGELASQNMSAAKRQVQKIGEQSGRIRLQRAIDLYQAEKGFCPESLSVLVPSYIPAIPVGANGQSYGYDSMSGKLYDPGTGRPSGMTSNDRYALESIQMAIHTFGQTTGYYPTSLQAMVPTYLEYVPMTESGQDFFYDPNNGDLRHPAEMSQYGRPQYGASQFQTQGMGRQSNGQQAGRQQSRRRTGGGIGMGGGGPMGEMMTGIAMQNELNSMSNAGSASAGSYMRGKVNQQGQYGDRQSQVMDELDL